MHEGPAPRNPAAPAPDNPGALFGWSIPSTAPRQLSVDAEPTTGSVDGVPNVHAGSKHLGDHRIRIWSRGRYLTRNIKALGKTR